MVDDVTGAVTTQIVPNTYVYTHTTHDDVYTVDETRKLHTTEIFLLRKKKFLKFAMLG